jgi:hypothetical protein
MLATSQAQPVAVTADKIMVPIAPIARSIQLGPAIKN